MSNYLFSLPDPFYSNPLHKNSTIMLQNVICKQQIEKR